jgi:HEAT repeat protein
MLELAKQRKMSKRKMSLESDVAPYLDVRRFAAAVLGGVPNRDVTDQLISVLGDGDKDLAQDALNSLVQHGDTVGSLPAAAQEPLLELYGLTATDSIRVLALRALSRLGDAAVPTLREALTDPDPHIRVEAVRGLDDNGIADASIQAALKDGYIGVGIAAAKSLARHQGAGALEALIEFAFLNDGTHRREVGQMLGLHAPQEALNRLIELASDDTRLRERVVVIDALAEVITATDQSRELNAA